MSHLTNTIFYILTFVAIYVQVFYLVTFLENRKKLGTTKINDLPLALYPTVSILVPCYNESRSVLKTVNSILSLEYPKEKIQIIVIDDGSTDDTWQQIQRYNTHSNIQLVQKENGGKSSALNLGLTMVTGELVASVDGDTYLPETALRDIVQYFLNNPKTMAVGSSTIISRPKTIVQKAQSAEYNLFIFTKKMLAFTGGALVLPGAFSVYRKTVFDTIGGYKTGHNLEDLELTYRMQVNGYKVDHAHDVFAYTSAPASLKTLFKQRLRWAYGFLNNTLDYRKAILNRNYGTFGVFTIPTALIAYGVILYVFFLGWYRVISGIVQKVIEIKIVGISRALHSAGAFDLFKIDTRATALLTSVLFISVLAYLMIGRKFAKESKSSYASVIYFFLLYNIIAPFWIIKAIYNTAISKQVAWK